jgi:hypothetical protein
VELVHSFIDRVHNAQCTGLLPRGRSTQDGGMRFYEIERLFSKLISVVGEWIKGHDLVGPRTGVHDLRPLVAAQPLTMATPWGSGGFTGGG